MNLSVIISQAKIQDHLSICLLMFVYVCFFCIWYLSFTLFTEAVLLKLEWNFNDKLIYVQYENG